MRTKLRPLDSETLSGDRARAVNDAAKLWRAGNGLTHNATAETSGMVDLLDREDGNHLISFGFPQGGLSAEESAASASPVAKQMILQQYPEDALDWGSTFGGEPKHMGSGDHVSSSSKSSIIREYPLSTMEAAT